MKAKIYDEIKTLVDIPVDFGNRVLAKGTLGTIIECYEQPQEGYAVDLAIPDERWVGGFDYENVILFPEQFVVVNPAEKVQDVVTQY
ncbi:MULTISPECIES: hypothetical protein [Aerosakkonema]|uniref:hypothetical protein n=1 Tax=Aerosakkonema TaxID=1246629 RepID=UPI0035B77CEA